MEYTVMNSYVIYIQYIQYIPLQTSKICVQAHLDNIHLCYQTPVTTEVLLLGVVNQINPAHSG